MDNTASRRETARAVHCLAYLFSVTLYFFIWRKCKFIFDWKKQKLHPLDLILTDLLIVPSFYVKCVNIALKWNGLLLGELHTKQRGLFQSDIPYVDDKAYIGLFIVLVDICN